MPFTNFPYGATSFGLPLVGAYEVTAYGKLWWVDTVNGSDGNDGTSPSTAFKTVGKAITKLNAYDTILIKGTPNETTTPILADFISVLGVGPTTRATWWKSSTSTSPCLEIQGDGCRVFNIRFDPPTGSSGVRITRSATKNAQYTQVIGCEFNGGEIGIESNGGSAEVLIKDCLFHDITSSTTPTGAIISTSTAQADPLRWVIEHCYFSNNINHIVLPGNDCLIKNCAFTAEGNSITTTAKINLSGATGWNNVVGNTFPGTYSIAGGYTPGTNDTWINNYGTSGLLSAVPA